VGYASLHPPLKPGPRCATVQPAGDYYLDEPCCATSHLLRTSSAATLQAPPFTPHGSLACLSESCEKRAGCRWHFLIPIGRTIFSARAPASQAVSDASNVSSKDSPCETLDQPPCYPRRSSVIQLAFPECNAEPPTVLTRALTAPLSQ
jgi:hypothetical protein